MRTLKTVPQVLDALGGNLAVRRLLDLEGPNVVANWRWRERLPPRTYLPLSDALRRRGLKAPPKLWGLDG